jgi:DNA-binding XRE family transcriptional regulator
MNKQEQQDWKRLANVVRCARKDRSLRQATVSAAIGVSQGAYSKFEAGKLVPSVSQWFELCAQLGVHPEHVYYLGRIDNMKKVTVRDVPRYGSFKLGKPYSQDAGTSIRNALPFTETAQQVLGPRKWQEYLDDREIDPDFFYNYDHQVHFRLIGDLIELIKGKHKGLKEDGLMTAARLAKSPEAHGQLTPLYKKATSKLSMLKQFVTRMNYYEADFTYEIESEGKNSIDVSMKPSPEIHSYLEEHKDVYEGYCEYISNRLQNFSDLQPQLPGTISTHNHRHTSDLHQKRIFQLSFAS